MVIRRINDKELLETVRAASEEEGLELAEFVRLGRANQLRNPELRDLWLMFGAALRDVDLSSVG
jgi:hypothetical protein